MWSLGKVINTPEVCRVYIGSFWDHPLQHDTNRKLFELEEHDLFADLQSLPRNAALRKLNDLIKRARLAKVIEKQFFKVFKNSGISCKLNDKVLFCDKILFRTTNQCIAINFQTLGQLTRTGIILFFSSRRRHTRFALVSWARRCV